MMPRPEQATIDGEPRAETAYQARNVGEARLAMRNRQPDRIETERLVLRRFEQRDVDALARQLALREMAMGLGRLPHPYGSTEARDFIAYAATGAEDIHAVCLRERDEPIGSCGIGMRRIADGTDRATLGYWIGRDHWNQGYASEAVAAKLFEHFAGGGGTVQARVFQDNPGSRAVLEHVGFRIVASGLDTNAVREGDHPVWIAACTADDFRNASWNIDSRGRTGQ